jgi:2-polyprenyl-6-hydroxyphenyl methylase/3-demethylubiquinone-9 3-methyltransferase
LDISVYEYQDGEMNHSHDYILPKFLELLKMWSTDGGNLFEVGFGNGAVANRLTKLGYSVIGVDPSKDGVHRARDNYPNIALFEGSTGDSLFEQFGQFNMVYSLEVIEHVFDPFEFISTINSLLLPDGKLILSTPYHGYFKNLAISIVNGWDKHFTSLWRGGHIKFWSTKTIAKLLESEGFTINQIEYVGRLRFLAKSMLIVATKD